MTTRVGESLNAGTLVPKKHSKVVIQYVDPITHFGYYAKTDSGDSFLGRLEVEVDGQGREIRIEYFTDDGGLF